MMKNRTYKRRLMTWLAALLVVFLAAPGCSKIKDIKVTSCSLDSFTPRGLRSARAQLSVCVENPAMGFTLSDISGVLYYKGEEFALYSADPVEISPRSTAVYPLSCSASLADGVSVLTFMNLLRNYDLADFTTTIEARVKLKSGATKKLKFKDLQVGDLVNEREVI